MTEPGEPGLLTPREAARRLAVTVETLRRWELDGRLTAQRTIGGHRRYPATIIDALAEGKAAS